MKLLTYYHMIQMVAKAMHASLFNPSRALVHVHMRKNMRICISNDEVVMFIYAAYCACGSVQRTKSIVLC